MKFTNEEIDLCKQVVEKYKKEIKYGDWYLNQADEKDFPQLCRYVQNENVTGAINEYIVPLWTISDCLEFLRKRGYRVKLDEDGGIGVVEPFSANCYGHKSKKAFYKYGNSYLEACLKAVLAVLEETK